MGKYRKIGSKMMENLTKGEIEVFLSKKEVWGVPYDEVIEKFQKRSCEHSPPCFRRIVPISKSSNPADLCRYWCGRFGRGKNKCGGWPRHHDERVLKQQFLGVEAES